MSESDEGLPEITIVCTACDTETAVPFEKVEGMIDRHNERQHDADPIAEIDPEIRSRLQDLLAEEMGLFD